MTREAYWAVFGRRALSTDELDAIRETLDLDLPRLPKVTDEAPF